jgi:hypothetical protein
MTNLAPYLVGRILSQTLRMSTTCLDRASGISLEPAAREANHIVAGFGIADQVPADAVFALGMSSPVTNSRPGISTNR